MSDPIRLGRGEVRAVVVPELGGRILSLARDGREFLWRDDSLLDDGFRPRVPRVLPERGAGFAAWQNWGGDKTWPAPQGWDGPGSWPGPPDPVLDAGPYDVTMSSGDRVVLRSAVDASTGVQIERDIAVRGDTLVVGSRIVNRVDRPLRWAAWEVMQVPFGEEDLVAAVSGILVDADTPEIVRLMEPSTPVPAQPEAEGIRVRFADTVGKLGFPSASGRVRVTWSDGAALRLAFAPDPRADYPDGSPLQLWMQAPVAGELEGLDGLRPSARLIEVEPMSPLRTLAPGESVRVVATWTPTVG